MMYELAPQKFADLNLDLPESDNNLSDVLDEVKFELDWMLKMQAADGGVYHKVNTQNFPPAVLPERDKQPRFIYEVGTADTGIFAGGMAVAARAFRTVEPAYADILQAAAIRSGAFLLQHKDEPPLWPSNDNTGAYKSDDASDEVFWAFAELFRLTGDVTYLHAILPLNEKWLEFNDFGWENTSAFGMYALAQAEKTPDDMRSMLRDRIRQKAEQLTAHINSNGYRTALRADQFHWASNKVACALGVNTLSKSFVTDVGVDGVRYPHHRIVEAVGTLVPGLLVGGPNTDAQDKSYPQGSGPRGYRDLFASYASKQRNTKHQTPIIRYAYIERRECKERDFNRG